MASRSYAEMHQQVRTIFTTAGISPGVWAVRKNKIDYLIGRGLRRRQESRTIMLAWAEERLREEVELVVARIKYEDKQGAQP